MPNSRTRILIADDHPLVRRGVAGLLAKDAALEICGEAKDGDEALKKTRELRPDLVLLDISMPGASGLETAVVLRLEFPELRILMMSQHDPGQLLPRALEAGANGCIDKSNIAADLQIAIRNLMSAGPLARSATA